jgi:predicted metal-dependent phosphoesterase TrpH
VRADLHTHSNASDGTGAPAEVMRRAREAGLDVIALTDHDTVAGHEEARRLLPPGLTLVTGMELSCRLDGHSVHMLAYRFDPGDDDLAGVIARPAEAFTADWLAAGGRAYVSRYALDPTEAIRLVRAAGGVTVLAHPGAAARGWRISDEGIARLAAAGLAGLEIDHPDHDEAERGRLRTLAEQLDLVATGGSDDHGSLTGYRLGCETTSPEAFRRLMSLAGTAG